MKVLILVNTTNRLDENHAMFANGFLERGWHVFYGLVNSLTTHDYEVYCDIVEVKTKVNVYGKVIGELSHQSAEQFDLVWVMNQPHPMLAKDAWQILWLLSQRCPFVNSVEAMTFLNNKNTLGHIVSKQNLVENHVSNRFDHLWQVYISRKNERWIVKPTNGGCGADVYLLKPEESNARAIIQSMTGNTTASAEITDSNLLGLQNKYGILQSYAPEVAKGEKRVIIAGGRVVSQHGRSLAAEDHRSNITQGGELLSAELNDDEYKICSELGRRLLLNGVRFIGIDLAYPFVLEFNIVNPGGIYDIREVSGIDYTQIAIENILQTIEFDRVDSKEFHIEV